MYLCIRHGTGIKPYVNQVRFALHRLAVFRDKDDIVHVRTVQVYLVVILFGIYARLEALLLVRVRLHQAGSHRFLYFVVELFYRLDTLFLAIVLCTPDGQWSTPIA